MAEKKESIAEKLLIVILPTLFITFINIGFLKTFENKINMKVESKNLLFKVASPKMSSLYGQFPLFVENANKIIDSGYYSNNSPEATSLEKSYENILYDFMFLDIYYTKDNSIKTIVKKIKDFYLNDLTNASAINPKKQRDLRNALYKITKIFNASAKKINSNLITYLD
ncbi:hypothetical protein [Solidesulfovibrio sp. C21]|uniref:hypothetical protein n=1 Tax=Solidesulfovibrio sp. C21 TaxID=3398613 RepID=UPI0039FBB35C